MSLPPNGSLAESAQEKCLDAHCEGSRVSARETWV